MTLSASGASIVRYSSRRGALHESFLAQVLPDAERYDRIAGYFSSSLLEVAGEMVESVKGKVRVICNSDLQPRDVETARAANAAMRQEWCASKPEQHTATPQGRSRFQRLYDLLHAGKLDVRVLPNEVFGLIHGKAGVIWPAQGDPVAFIGSANETGQGWAQNYELVWSHRDAESVAWVCDEFEALWNHPQAVPLAEFICEDA
ncbi:MAG: helicase SNF2, partial [Proteobacteria bacterium]|nr:helicase SNF2 [Pseudomonadota bacterium]